MKLIEVKSKEITPQTQYSPLRNESVVNKLRDKSKQSFKQFQRIKLVGFRMFEPKRRIKFSEIEQMRSVFESMIGTKLYTRAYSYTVEIGQNTNMDGGDENETPNYIPIMQSVTFYIGQVPAGARVRYEIKT